MVLRPLRKVALPDQSEQAGAAWLAELGTALAAPGADWYRIARDTLAGIWYPGLDVDRALAEKARGLDRWLVGAQGAPMLPAALGRMKAGVLSLVFAMLLVVVSEPFLLKAAPPSEPAMPPIAR